MGVDVNEKSIQPVTPQVVHYVVHSCMKSGYHKLGAPRYLQGKFEKFVRHCKYCSYVFAGGIEVTGSGKVRIVCINEFSKPVIVENGLGTTQINIESENSQSQINVDDINANTGSISENK